MVEKIQNFLIILLIKILSFNRENINQFIESEIIKGSIN